MAQFYEEICNMFIRPPRQKYKLHDLGSPVVRNVGLRRDFDVVNSRKMKLKCSFYQALQPKHDSCIIYLHSFNGSRLQSLKYGRQLLERGYNFCNFDFSGSGISEGEFVSLGYHERDDLLEVIRYLMKNFGMWNFSLWGRSMGASTIIKFSQHLKEQRELDRSLAKVKIESAILDSPFCSVSRLAIEIAKKKITMPEIFLRAVFLVIKNTIEKKAEFRVSQLELLELVQHINFPVLIITSQDDSLVNGKHSEDIYYKLTVKERQMIFIRGQHHQVRDNETVQKMIKFLVKSSRQTKQKLKKSTVREDKNRTMDRARGRIYFQSLSRQKQPHLLNGRTSSDHAKLQNYKNDVQRNRFQYEKPEFGSKVANRQQPMMPPQVTLSATYLPLNLQSIGIGEDHTINTKKKLESQYRISPRLKYGLMEHEGNKSIDNIARELDFIEEGQFRMPSKENQRRSYTHLITEYKSEKKLLEHASSYTKLLDSRKNSVQHLAGNQPANQQILEQRFSNQRGHLNIINSKLRKRKQLFSYHSPANIAYNQQQSILIQNRSSIGCKQKPEFQINLKNQDPRILHPSSSIKKTFNNKNIDDQEAMKIKFIQKIEARCRKISLNRIYLNGEINLGNLKNSIERDIQPMESECLSYRKVDRTKDMVGERSYLQAASKNKCGAISLTNLERNTLRDSVQQPGIAMVSQNRVRMRQSNVHKRTG